MDRVAAGAVTSLAVHGGALEHEHDVDATVAPLAGRRPPRRPARYGPATPRSAGHAADGAHPERPIVVLRDVTKTYPNGKTALRDVDLVVPEGDFVFLVGPSGAGKSTLIKLLIRDELPTSGEIVLGNADLARLPRRQVARIRRKIGIVFQDFKLLPTKSVRENVAFALEVTGTPRREIGPAVDRALALVGPDAPRPASCRRRCRAASSSARPSPGRSSTTRGSSSPTSPPATSTRSSAGRSSSSSCASTSSA